MEYFQAPLRLAAGLLAWFFLFAVVGCNQQETSSQATSFDVSFECFTVRQNHEFPIDGVEFEAEIIKSVAEIEAEFGADYKIVSTRVWDDESFKENVVILIRFCHPGYYDKVESLTRSGNQLIVNYSSFGPDYSDESPGRQEVLEVKKSDIEGIIEILPERNVRPVSEALAPTVSNA